MDADPSWNNTQAQSELWKSNFASASNLWHPGAWWAPSQVTDSHLLSYLILHPTTDAILKRDYKYVRSMNNLGKIKWRLMERKLCRHCARHRPSKPQAFLSVEQGYCHLVWWCHQWPLMFKISPNLHAGQWWPKTVTVALEDANHRHQPLTQWWAGVSVGDNKRQQQQRTGDALLGFEKGTSSTPTLIRGHSVSYHHNTSSLPIQTHLSGLKKIQQDWFLTIMTINQYSKFHHFTWLHLLISQCFIVCFFSFLFIERCHWMLRKAPIHRIQ